METSYLLERPIYPDADEIDNIPNLDKFLEKYGISITFLLEGGIVFKVTNPDIEIKPKQLGDVSFFRKSPHRHVILIFVENFGKISFMDDQENELFCMKIIEG